MLNTYVVPARNLQKSYKSIIQDVKAKKRAVVLTTNNKPQAALVSLEDLEKLKSIKARSAAIAMLQLAIDNFKELKHLPSSLRVAADEILYNK